MKNLAHLLRVVITANLLLAGSTAYAAWVAPTAGNGQPIPVINQGAVDIRRSLTGIATNAVYQLGSNESMIENDTITITLTGGAVWSTTRPTLTPSAGDLGGGASATPPLNGGLPGQTTAIWRAIDRNVVSGVTLTLNSDQTIYDLSDMDGPVDVLISLETGGRLPLGPQHQSLNTALESAPLANDAYQFALSELTTNTVITGTPATDIAQVSERYTVFADDATSTATTGFQTKNNTSVIGVPNASIAAGQLVYTLVGDFAGIASISGTGITGSDQFGDQTSGIAGEFLLDASLGKAWGSNSNAIAPGSTLNNSITITIDGVTPQTDRSFTLEANIVEDFNYLAHTAIPTTTINTIVTNGTVFTTNVLGPFNDIRITDSSGTASTSGGEIIITAYTQSGEPVPRVAGATALPAAVGSYETVTISGVDLLANFPNAVVFDFMVNTASATVANIQKTDNGTNINVLSNGKSPAL